jgi:2,4-dienoyl-CoA reductase-like NADH-dependent reductase (Old Yellow Enzyme family)
MSILFEPTLVNGMELANRFVRSATFEGMATTDGKPTARLVETMAELAAGGVGLIITGHCYVNPEGQARAGQVTIGDESALPGLTRMAEAAHRLGGKIALQIAHAGAHAQPVDAGLQPMGPSVFYQDDTAICREMTGDDISRVVEAFARAADRAKRAGFDAVQIHAAHGYLLSQFLSPWSNHRTDEYGGPLANRGRAVLEVLRAVRQAVGSDYPVLIKVNSEDFIEGGFSVEDMLALSTLLEQAGIDAIEMSGGTFNTASRYPVARLGASKENMGYYQEAARRFKRQVKVPLILVGGLRTVDAAEHLVADGIADYIALSRPLICEPGLVNRWKGGDKAKSLCVSDNRCFKAARSGEGVRCVFLEERESTALEQGRSVAVAVNSAEN